MKRRSLETSLTSFEKMVMPIPWSGCHEWMGFTQRYGKFSWEGGQLAHRFAYEAYVGEIPEGMEVCHSCDNPSCVNPNHLFLGTHKDNMQDRHRKGRYQTMPKGEDHHMAKLTVQQVEWIKTCGLATKDIMWLLKLSKTHVNDIKRGDVWQTKV